MAAASAARDPGAKIRITVLGATGSIGQSLADLIQRNPDSYEVVALVANRNAAGLADMAKALKTGSAILAEESCYPELKERLAGSGIATGAGEAAAMRMGPDPVGCPGAARSNF